ncbi:MAG: LemA family protein [Chloroflexi bacterium]|nr:MAG: LemA family protein [Chloroflexota bacterium]
MGWWILLGAVILVVLWLVFTYNGLITARNRTQEAWSEIDVELKRRHDLIPNLVNTVSGYMGHERGTLEAVTNARANAVAAGATGDPAKIGQAENVLSQSLRSLFAVSRRTKATARCRRSASATCPHRVRCRHRPRVRVDRQDRAQRDPHPRANSGIGPSRTRISSHKPAPPPRRPSRRPARG